MTIRWAALIPFSLLVPGALALAYPAAPWSPFQDLDSCALLGKPGSELFRCFQHDCPPEGFCSLNPQYEEDGQGNTIFWCEQCGVDQCSTRIVDPASGSPFMICNAVACTTTCTYVQVGNHWTCGCTP